MTDRTDDAEPRGNSRGGSPPIDGKPPSHHEAVNQVQQREAEAQAQADFNGWYLDKQRAGRSL